jgi:hypothetical protein
VRLMICISIAGFLSGCATPSSMDIMDERQSKSKANPYAYDSFYSSNLPEREVRASQFYYKNCRLDERSTVYPKKTEWACDAPF